MRALALSLCLLAPPVAATAQTLVIDVTGQALQNSTDDQDSARRRALADALLQAAMAGGAKVTGHSVLDKARITSDLVIVRPVGRVLGHQVLAQSCAGGVCQVTIRATVGPEGAGGCQNRKMQVIAYAPEIRVSSSAPAWAEPLAQRISRTILERLARTRDVTVKQITNRPPPRQGQTSDYLTLTQGSVHLNPGDQGLVLRIDMNTEAAGLSGKALTLDLDITFLGGQGESKTYRLHRAVKLPGVSPLGRVAELAKPGRDRLAADLAGEAEPYFADLMQQKLCEPVSIVLSVSGGTISAPVGRAQGLTRGTIAFTADRNASTEMLEIVELGAERVVLRPLDPGQPASAFAGRPVQFLESDP